MLHVSDAAKTMLLAGISGLWTNKVVNVASENTTVSDIASSAAHYLGIDVDWSESKEPDKRDYAMDCSRYNSISAELAPLLKVGDIGAMAGIRSSILSYGKQYPTRLEQLRTWFDNQKDT
jgi:nucleoside-diphosphate-sugar epimerase